MKIITIGDMIKWNEIKNNRLKHRVGKELLFGLKAKIVSSNIEFDNEETVEICDYKRENGIPVLLVKGSDIFNYQTWVSIYNLIFI